MKARYFDDLKVGDRFKSEPLNVTEKKLIEFAHKFDPQVFHLSRKGAERTIFKRLIASGWYTIQCDPATCSRLRRRFLIGASRARGLATGSFVCAT
jgi:hypothetical protein